MPFTITPPNNIQIETNNSNQNIGKELWSSLNLTSDAFVLTREILDIVIESQDAQTLQLPWELLYHPTYGFLAQNPNFTLSRKIPNLPTVATPLEKRALRILFFSTLPDDIGKERLSVEREQEVVMLQSILPFKQEGLVAIYMPNDGRFESLKTLIEKNRPDMVFLSGHSSYKNGKGSFLFEDKQGLCVAIDEDELKSAFVGSSVECVVLSSCQSAMADKEELNSGLLMSLASFGIKNVIGMRDSVDDEAGIIFAKHFIEQVANKKSVAHAVQKARDEIYSLKTKVQEHWHLPILVSQDISRPLVDWDFEPTPPTQESLNQRLNQISYPSTYVGRRKEFRAFYNYLYGNSLKKLLIYGEGGIGKTAMVAKFGWELKDKNYKVFDYSLKHGEDFEDFLLDIELELSEENSRKFNLIKERCSDEACIVKRLTKLLLQEHKRVAFIFDNLEDVQNPTTKEIEDEKLKAWIETLSKIDNVVVLITSRWELANCEHNIRVNKPIKSDFLYFLSMQNIKVLSPTKLEKIFEILGGNYRGVELFLQAIKGMKELDEEQFLDKLSTATREIQIDMAIDKILSYLTQEERELLERITVYDVPVPKEGVRKVALNLPKEALDRLVSFSLVEESYNPIYETNEYQISALVFYFIKDSFVLNNEIKILASDYLFWLFFNERKRLNHATVTYYSLKKAEKDDKADRFALKWIIRNLETTGFTIELLENWLPQIIESENKSIKAEALNIKGKLCIQVGDEDIALKCFEEAYSLYKEINEINGIATLLNNLGIQYQKQGNLEKALAYFEESKQLSIEEKDKVAESRSLHNIYYLYKQEGNPKALSTLAETYKLQIKIGDKKGEATSYISMSTFFKGQKALKFLNRALDIQEELKNYVTISSIFFNMGIAYMDENDTESAVNCWILSYKYAKELKVQNVLNSLEEIGKKVGFKNGLDYFELIKKKRGI